MNHIKGVFFDLHGTLLLSDDVDKAWDEWSQAFHEAMKNRGAQLDLIEFRKVLSQLFDSPEPEYSAPGLSLFERRVMQLCGNLGLPMPRDELRPFVDRIIRVWHRDMYLDPETEEVLSAIKKQYKVGLITNWEHTPRITELLEELKMGHLFDTVVVSDDVGVAKPLPEIFDVAFRQTGILSSEAVYVGDMDVDVQGSINAGVHPVLIQRPEDNGRWGQYTSENHSDYDPEKVTYISALNELLTIFGLK
ncbi:MAG: HAD family hydrolase [Candidatus Bathyarchaeota archaeon]|nr:HAD family hydrolase [Candidatus Bathyarchaeota archaeon]